MTTDGDKMSCWDDIAHALEEVDLVSPSRASVAALRKTIVTDGADKPDPDESPDQAAQALATVDRAWLVQLGPDPDTRRRNELITSMRAPAERANALIKHLKALRHVTHSHHHHHRRSPGHPHPP